ncbi:hypothetical protein GN956_G14062 [Arapaima gigas]
MLEKEWNVVCITDVVYNHAAADSSWIGKHPERGNILMNSPQLKPAWVLDRTLWHLTCNVPGRNYSNQRLLFLIQSSQQSVESFGKMFSQLWEFFQVDVEKTAELFQKHLKSEPFREHGRLLARFLEGKKSVKSNQESKQQLKIVQDSQYRCFASSVNMNTALETFIPHGNSPSAILLLCCNRVLEKPEELNGEWYREIQHHQQKVFFHFSPGATFN